MIYLSKIVVVGLGSIGCRHVRNIRKLLDDTEIIALRHKPGDFSTGCPEVDCQVYSVEEALALGPEAAIIANPAPFHLDVAKRFAEAGVHLFVEKPLSIYEQGVEEFFALCRQQNICLRVGYNLRFMNSFRKFYSLINNDTVGRVYSFRAEVGSSLLNWRPGRDYRKTVSARKSLGGGVLLELSHEFDYLALLFGPVTRVTAVVKRLSNLSVDVEDTAFVILECKGKAKIPVIGALSMDCYRHDAKRECQVIAGNGTLRWDGTHGMTEIFRQEVGTWECIYSDPHDLELSYCRELEEFFRCIGGEREDSLAARTGINALRLVGMVRRSAMHECTVDMKNTG